MKSKCMGMVKESKGSNKGMREVMLRGGVC